MFPAPKVTSKIFSSSTITLHSILCLDSQTKVSYIFTHSSFTLQYQIGVMLVLFFSENLFLCFLLIKYVFCLTYSIKNQIKLTEFWYFGPVLVLFSALLLFDTGEYLPYDLILLQCKLQIDCSGL